MSRPLPLWGIIEGERRSAHYIDRAIDAGVTRLIGPGAPDVVDLARSRGLEVHPYVACTPLPTHGQRPVSYTWSLNYLGVDPHAPETRAILDRHRPILVGPNRGEPSVGPFAAAHPEYWARTADGSDTLGFCDRLGLSPAFPEVRDSAGGGDRTGAGRLRRRRRAGGVRERHGGCPTGWCRPVTRSVRWRNTGQASGRDARALPADDPGWLAFRAGYVTEMLVEARERVKVISEQAVFSATIIAREPDRSLHGLHDWPAWTERGVLDELYLWFRTESDPGRARAPRPPCRPRGGRPHPAVRRALLLSRRQLPGAGAAAGRRAPCAGRGCGRRRRVPAPRGRSARPVGNASRDRPPVVPHARPER